MGADRAFVLENVVCCERREGVFRKREARAPARFGPSRKEVLKKRMSTKRTSVAGTEGSGSSLRVRCGAYAEETEDSTGEGKEGGKTATGKTDGRRLIGHFRRVGMEVASGLRRQTATQRYVGKYKKNKKKKKGKENLGGGAVLTREARGCGET